MNNLMDTYLKFTEKKIKKYLKAIFSSYYNEEFVSEYLKTYINARYYNVQNTEKPARAFYLRILDELNFKEDTLMKRCEEEAQTLDEKQNKLNLIHCINEVFGYILFFDNVRNIENFKTIDSLKEIIEKIAEIVDSTLDIKMAQEIEDKLYKEIKDDIIKNIKALFFHKIAGFIVSSTDTILISVFFEGLVTVAYYSNYNLVLSAITTILNQFLLSATASIGDLLTENNKERNYEIYKKLNFLNFVIFIIGATGMACAIEPFITIFFGEQYILSKFILISLILKFFIQGMRRPLMAFKEAAGIFYVDRFVPILESVVNLVASIILLKICGLAGIFLGTAVSSLVILLYSYPKYVYRPIFNKRLKDYYLEFIKTILYATVIIGITMGVNQLIRVSNIFAEQVLSVVVAIIIPVIIITLVSFLIGAILSIVLLATKIKKSNEYIPFGPFIVIATFISIYVPFEQIKAFLMTVFTLGLYQG